MKDKIVKPTDAEKDTFLTGTLISADFLNPEKIEGERITNWQTEQDDDCEAELPDPTEIK